MHSQTEQSFLFSRNNLDLIRLFAASQVVLIHALKHLHVDFPWVKWLSVFPGVPIFFFISGLLIYRSYGRSDSFKDYLANRFLRIYPALWVCLLLSVILVFATGFLDVSFLGKLQFWTWISAQATVVQFFNPDFLREFGVGVLNGSLWTISIELQFYFLTPIVFWIVSKGRIFFLILLLPFLLLNAFRDIMPFDGVVAKLYSVSFIPWFGMFLLGAWISTEEKLIKKLLTIRLHYIILLFIVVDALAYTIGWEIQGNSINTLSFICLILLVIKLAYTKPNLSKSLLVNNDISYGVYIYHMPIVNFAIYMGGSGRMWSVLCVILITYFFAMTSWFLVEKPALSLKKKTIRV